MYNIQVRPSRDLRNHYPEIRELLKEHNPVIITNNGKGEAVLIGIEDYAEYEEFIHYRYVQKSLEEARSQAEDPNTQWLSHEDVWGSLEKKYGL